MRRAFAICAAVTAMTTGAAAARAQTSEIEPARTPVASPAPAPPLPYAYWPARLKYRDGEPVPMGYHVEKGPRTGLIIAGSITFGVLYGLAVLVASDSHSTDEAKAMWVPCVGPFIAAASLKDQNSGGAAMFLVLWGLGETAGVAMLIGGILGTKTELVRNDLARVHVFPIVSKSTAGLGLGAAF